MIEFNEQQTKEYISSLSKFTKSLLHSSLALPPSINDALSECISKLAGETSQFLKLVKKPGKIVDKCFSLEPNILFNYKNPKLKGHQFYVSFGGYIKIENSILIDQSFNIMLLYRHTSKTLETDFIKDWQCHAFEDGLHVLRRFHFDLDLKNDGINKPKSHLQYGGKLNKDYFNLTEEMQYKLFGPLDHPRIPIQPYDLIMLFDFLFREFLVDGHQIIKEKSWIGNIIESERFWLKPYYERLISRINISTRQAPIHYLKEH